MGGGAESALRVKYHLHTVAAAPDFQKDILPILTDSSFPARE